MINIISVCFLCDRTAVALGRSETSVYILKLLMLMNFTPTKVGIFLLGYEKDVHFQQRNTPHTFKNCTKVDNTSLLSVFLKN